MVTLDWRTKGQKILPIGDNYHVCACLKIFKLYFSIISFYKELIIWMIEGWYEWIKVSMLHFKGKSVITF